MIDYASNEYDYIINTLRHISTYEKTKRMECLNESVNEIDELMNIVKTAAALPTWAH